MTNIVIYAVIIKFRKIMEVYKMLNSLNSKLRWLYFKEKYNEISEENMKEIIRTQIDYLVEEFMR